MKTLLVLTDTYPAGSHETFLEAEIPFLAEAWEQVVILPRRPAPGMRAVPSGVRVSPPVCRGNSRASLVWGALCSGWGPAGGWREAVSKRVWARGAHARRWMEAVCLMRAAAHRVRREVHRWSGEGPTLVYSYWGAGPGWMLPAVPEGVPTVARFHGFDLYPDRPDNQGYLPFHQAVLNRADHWAPISEHGERQLARLRPDRAGDIHLHRLGVADYGVSPPGDDGVFRIATCSRVVGLKRLHLLVSALVDWRGGPVEWTHFGDGPLLEALKKQTRALPASVQMEWRGAVSNPELRKIYAAEPVDLFVNVSGTEGAPVSIMEALASGIGVLATDVGGTGELITPACGRLLPADLSAQILREALEEEDADRTRLRARGEAARMRWGEVASADVNYSRFARWLLTCL